MDINYQKLGQNVAVSDSTNQTVQVEDDRTGMSIETLKRAFADNLLYIQGKDESSATLHDYYQALAYTVRDFNAQISSSGSQQSEGLRAKYFKAIG